MKPRTPFEKMRRNRARQALCVSTAQLREEAVALGYDDTGEVEERLMRAPPPQPRPQPAPRRWWHGLPFIPQAQRS